jgi:hypothetical protein
MESVVRTGKIARGELSGLPEAERFYGGGVHFMDFSFMANAECKLTFAAFCFILWPLIGNHEGTLCNNVNTAVNLSTCVTTKSRRFYDCHDRMSPTHITFSLSPFLIITTAETVFVTVSKNFIVWKIKK